MDDKNDMWKMLMENQFEVDDRMKPYVTCIICNKILIDAYQGPCGCKYCLKCIKKYLDGNQLYCPGDMDMCKTTEISLDSITKDNASNRSVSQLEVTCPSTSCTYCTKIMLMDSHLMVCGKRSVPCPFTEIGCTEVSIPIERMSDHLVAEIAHHTGLMCEWMTNLRNEMLFTATVATDNQLDLSQHEYFQHLDQSIELKLSQASITNRTTDKMEQELISNMQSELSYLRSANADLIRLMNEMREKSNEQIRQYKEEIIEQSREISELRRALLMETREENQIAFCERTIESDITGSFDRQSSMSPSTAQHSPSIGVVSFVWTVAEIYPSTGSVKALNSDYFHFKHGGLCRAFLKLYPHGCHEHPYTDVCVAIYVDASVAVVGASPKPNDTLLVTVTMVKNPIGCERISKQCKLNIATRRWWQLASVWQTGYLHFPMLELVQLQMLQNNSIAIECTVDVDR